MSEILIIAGVIGITVINLGCVGLATFIFIRDESAGILAMLMDLIVISMSLCAITDMVK